MQLRKIVCKFFKSSKKNFFYLKIEFTNTFSILRRILFFSKLEKILICANSFFLYLKKMFIILLLNIFPSIKQRVKGGIGTKEKSEIILKQFLFSLIDPVRVLCFKKNS